MRRCRGAQATLAEGDAQYPGAYYLDECDEWGRRAYRLVQDPKMRLQGPKLIGIPEGRCVEGDAEEIALFPEGTPHWFEPGPDTPPPEPEPEPVAMPKPAGAAPDLAGMDPAKKQQLLNLLSTLQQAQGAAS